MDRLALAGLILAPAAGCAGSGKPLPPLTVAEAAAEAAAVASLEARAREVIAGAIERLGERLGRPDPDPSRVRVKVVMGRTGPGTCAGKSPVSTSGHGDWVKIEICAEIFLKGLTLFQLSRKEEALEVLRRLAAGDHRDEMVWHAQEAIAKIEAGLRPTRRPLPMPPSGG